MAIYERVVVDCEKEKMSMEDQAVAATATKKRIICNT